MNTARTTFIACVALSALTLSAFATDSTIKILDHKPNLENDKLPDAVVWSETHTSPRPLRIHTLAVKVDSKIFEVAGSTGKDPDGSGPCDATLELPETLMEQGHLIAAVNGSAFRDFTNPDPHNEKWWVGESVDIRGCIANDSVIVSTNERYRAVFWMDKNGIPQIGISPDTNAIVVATADWLNSSANTNTTGELVRDGKIVAKIPAGLNPRTAIGYSADKKWVLMTVVDGRNKGVSEGVTLPELAEIMKTLGCTDAINLDGGGSSILLVKQGDKYVPINHPSGGERVKLKTHRPIPNVIGIRLK